MRTVCQMDQCAGCMACVDICSRNAVMIEDHLSSYNAVIDEDKCMNCDACFKVCPNNGNVEPVQPKEWYQGWAEDAEIRKEGSSGGVAQAIEKGFIQSGGVVISCAFAKGKFIFKTAETTDELKEFVGSKYVKSNPEQAYKNAAAYLRKGRKVLFVGLPCQVAAVKHFVPKALTDKLYTADLICHGTPSPKLLERYLGQYGIIPTEINTIRFRSKGKFQVFDDCKPVESVAGICDHYSIAFLNAVCYTENCYSCRYARQERMGDLTLGDAWGTSQNADEIRRGISLILCQTDKGKRLLDEGDIHVEDVDRKTAVEHNHQLREPMGKPRCRKEFFAKLQCGESFNSAVRHCCRWICLKQFVKKCLIKAVGQDYEMTENNYNG